MYLTDITLNVLGYHCKVSVYGYEQGCGCNPDGIGKFVDRVELQYCTDDDSIGTYELCEKELDENFSDYENEINEIIN